MNPHDPPTMESDASGRVVAIFRLLSYAMIAVAVLFGAAGLFGWGLDVEWLASLHPALPRMVPNTAVGLIVCVLSFVLLAGDRPARRRLGRLLAALVLLLSMLTLVEHAAGVSLGIDNLIFRGARLTADAPLGQPSLYTTLGFVALSLSLLLVDIETRRGARPAEPFAFAAILLALLVIAGFVYGAESFYALPGRLPAAAASLPGSLALLAFGLAILWRRPDHGLMAIVTSRQMGGVLARRLLLTALAFPILGLIAMIGQRAGLFSQPAAAALLAMAGLVLALPVVLSTSRSLNHLDGARRRFERERARLQATVNARLGLLAEVGATLARPLDEDATLALLARQLVPRLGDRCLIYLAGEEETPHLAASAQDPELPIEEAPPFDESALWSRAAHEPAPLFLPDGPPGGAPAQARSLLALPLRARGRLLGLLVLLYGASERRHDEADLALAAEIAARAALAIESSLLYQEALSAVRARNDLMAIVGHDLKNPLTAISLNAQILAGAGAPDRPLGAIRNATQRMRRLIEDLLVAGALEAGRMKVERAPEAIAQVIGESIDALSTIAASRQVALLAEAEELPAVSCDRRRTLQVLSNLIGNAVKFTPAGGTVTVRAQLAGDAVEVSVADTGPGISAELGARLFQRYSKGHSDGSGLGLFISKGLVEAQGGRIWYESAPGAGATLRFTLPLAAELEARAPLP